MIEAVNEMELLRNYYSIYSTIHNEVKDIIKSGNYEKIILDLMNRVIKLEKEVESLKSSKERGRRAFS